MKGSLDAALALTRRAGKNACLLTATSNALRDLEVLHSAAVYSKDMQYRYALWRIWENKPMVMFVGLNPSTATENENDPTVARCIARARHLGYGGLYMGNIFSFRSTDPMRLFNNPDPVGGSQTDLWLRRMAKASFGVVVAWGIHGALQRRGLAVYRLLSSIGHVQCLGKTAAGHPRHPLYLSYKVRPKVYSP